MREKVKALTKRRRVKWPEKAAEGLFLGAEDRIWPRARHNCVHGGAGREKRRSQRKDCQAGREDEVLHKKRKAFWEEKPEEARFKERRRKKRRAGMERGETGLAEVWKGENGKERCVG